MSTAKQLLDSIGHALWSVAPTTLVFDAIKLMAEKEIGALLVMDDENLVGIISERDYARKVILKDKSSKQIQVSEIMTATVVCVRPEQTVEECMALMTDKRFRHLPVLVDSRVIGVLSIGDLVKATIADQKFLIEQLEHYITS